MTEGTDRVGQEVPDCPYFVLSARDPHAVRSLEMYAYYAEVAGDAALGRRVREMAAGWKQHQATPEASP